MSREPEQRDTRTRVMWRQEIGRFRKVKWNGVPLTAIREDSLGTINTCVSSTPSAAILPWLRKPIAEAMPSLPETAHSWLWLHVRRRVLQGLISWIPTDPNSTVVNMLVNPRPGEFGTLGPRTLARWGAFSLDANAQKTFMLTESKQLSIRIDSDKHLEPSTA